MMGGFSALVSAVGIYAVYLLLFFTRLYNEYVFESLEMSLDKEILEFDYIISENCYIFEPDLSV